MSVPAWSSPNMLFSDVLIAPWQVPSMVASPPTPVSASSAPITQDEFNAVVQNTYGRYPLTIARGDGCKLYDSDGKASTLKLDVSRVDFLLSSYGDHDFVGDSPTLDAFGVGQSWYRVPVAVSTKDGSSLDFPAALSTGVPLDVDVDLSRSHVN